MRYLAFFLVALCLMFGTGHPAWAQYTKAANYSSWSTSPFAGTGASALFPYGLWEVEPQLTGNACSSGTTNAACMLTFGMNTFVSIFGWPQSAGNDVGHAGNSGEYAAIVAASAGTGKPPYVVGGSWVDAPAHVVPSGLNAQSVAGILSIPAVMADGSHLIGYVGCDEPNEASAPTPICYMSDTSSIVASIASDDSTRMPSVNQAPWSTDAENWLTSDWTNWVNGTLNPTTFYQTGADRYALVSPSTSTWLNAGYVAGSASTVANDSLYVDFVTVASQKAETTDTTRPYWGAVAVGDAWVSFGSNTISASYAAGGMGTVTLSPCNASPAWANGAVGGTGFLLTGPGLSGAVSTYLNPCQVNVSPSPTAPSSGAMITVSGGPYDSIVPSGNGSDCSAIYNICVVNGNQYRPTQEQIIADALGQIIAGARGIVIFANDTCDFQMGVGAYPGGFGMGNSGACGATSTSVASVETYLGNILTQAAPALAVNARAQVDTESWCATCSSGGGTWTVGTTGSNGHLSITDNTGVPAHALLTAQVSFGGTPTRFLAIQPERRGSTNISWSDTADLAGKTCTVYLDTNARFHPGTDQTSNSCGTSGAGTATFNNDYETLILEFQ